MAAFERIQRMLERCSTRGTTFPPTIIYNEGWMLRIVLDWFQQNSSSNHELDVPGNGRWYSEALLPSTFLPRYRGDKFAESWTHADGVIGHFTIGDSGKGDLSLNTDAKHFVVIEAKMFSKLSPGVTHAKYYNQAARNVACIAEVLRRADRKPANIERLGFYVVAPLTQIDGAVFSLYMSAKSIQNTVGRRITEYDEPKDEWLHDWFMPTLNRLEIGTISWECIVSFIEAEDAAMGESVKEFYDLCLKYNHLVL